MCIKFAHVNFKNKFTWPCFIWNYKDYIPFLWEASILVVGKIKWFSVRTILIRKEAFICSVHDILQVLTSVPGLEMTFGEAIDWMNERIRENEGEKKGGQMGRRDNGYGFLGSAFKIPFSSPQRWFSWVVGGCGHQPVQWPFSPRQLTGSCTAYYCCPLPGTIWLLPRGPVLGASGRLFSFTCSQCSSALCPLNCPLIG